MKRFLLIALLIVCCLPLASAITDGGWIDLTNSSTFGNFTGSGSFNRSLPLAQTTAWCLAKGMVLYSSEIDYNTTPSSINMEPWGSEKITYYSQGYDSVVSGAYKYREETDCRDNASTIYYKYALKYKYYLNNGTPLLPPVANFTATPLNGSAPLSVTFTDTSTGYGIVAWTWLMSPALGVIDSPTSANTVMHFMSNGNYTITHGVSNNIGSNISTKTNYIWIYNSNALVTTEFAAYDKMSGYNVNNASISLYDIQNTSWTNTTAQFGRAWISTLAGHTINAYGSSLGYKDADVLGVVARSAPYYEIPMFPTGVTNVSIGDVTLYITVKDDLGNILPGAYIFGGSEGYGVLANSTMFGLTTNAAGVASVEVPNKTNIHMQTSKTGYQTMMTVVYSGTGSGGDASVPVTVMLPRLTVTATITATPPPGGGTVVPTRDPYLDLSPEEKQTSLANQVLDSAPLLVGLFIFLTIFGGFKMMTKK